MSNRHSQDQNNGGENSANDNTGTQVTRTNRFRNLQEKRKALNKKERKNEAKWWHLWVYLILVALDTIVSVVLLTPIFPAVGTLEDLPSSNKLYTIHGSLWDVALLSCPRILSIILILAFSYHRLDYLQHSSSSSTHQFNLYKENGERKTKIELEEEALEEPFLPKLQRHVSRMSFLCEIATFLNGILLCLKCLSRLNVEIGINDEAKPHHPLFWIAISFSAVFSLLESTYVDSIERVAGELGHQRRQQLLIEQATNGVFSDGDVGDISVVIRRSNHHWAERISEHLARPLLSLVNSDVPTEGDEESATRASTVGENEEKRKDDRIPSGIPSDSEYAATWSDVMEIARPDMHLILFASVFLFAAAISNIYVPKFTGQVLDALINHVQNSNSTTFSVSDDINGSIQRRNDSITAIPGFLKNIELLLLVSILTGIFGGIRGAIFTMVGARVNVRLRILLMDNLLSQDIGFYDTTRTGDITSRLSSDTTLVGSSITTNVNIFLRAAVQAIGVLFFMFFISWQLSVLAFITVPSVSIISKAYGRYIRRLSRLQQKKLAEGNSVSESSMSAMQTVRSFGAESVELDEFEKCMEKYLTLNKHAAVAALGYNTCLNSLPEIVKAVALFYGGLLVQSDGPNHISGGQLVSFILYLSTLSQSFNSLGGVYASLVRAVGAADKVFELMNREPQYTKPQHSDPELIAEAVENKQKHILKVDATKVVKQRAAGLHPNNCTGDISFKDVEFSYPARPHRVVLDGLNLDIPAGSIVALVGASGSGKSSIVKLVNHLYEHSSGSVFIDGVDVRELSPDFVSKWISVVSQEPTLMARSVKRNIMYGLEGTDQEPTYEQIKEAAGMANAAAFIESLPQGYDTEVGERGMRLSGGQKQRIAIARALCRRPRILLLDEATSALDAESEHVVQEAIDGMISGQRSLDGDPSRSMTVIIIAHRLSTVHNADKIFVIKEGKVAEEGSHNELIQNEEGVYTGLIRRQMGSLSRTSSTHKMAQE